MITLSPAEIRVLLVEDNEGDYILTREMLEEHNRNPMNLTSPFRLTRVDSFKGALDKLGSERFDLILLDLSLPDAEGVETFYSIRAVAFNTPTIIFSGLDDERTALRAVQAGAQDYIIKGQLESALLTRAVRHAVERNRIVHELEQLKEEAIRANRLKSEFLFQIGMDIRTTLHKISATSELGLHAGGNGEARNYFNRMSDLTFSLSSTLHFVIDYARMELGQLSLNRAPFSLRELVRRVSHLMMHRTQEKELEIVAHVDDSLPDIFLGDTERVRQVLYAFVESALSFAEPRGGMAIVASLQSLSTHEAGVHFAVTSAGAGVPLEHQQLIFESIAQADASVVRKYGTSGLTLAVSSKIVSLMGGRMWLVSESKRGTAFHFTVTLPLG